MKRAGHLYHRIYEYDNLAAAFAKAVKGKHDRAEVIAFKQHFNVNMLNLQDQLIRHEPDIGHYRYFMVFDPKLRSICAASFLERVLHHAIMNVCEPVFEAYAVYDSYACRKGKGSLKALERATGFSRRFPWYLKLDIKKYFNCIDHGIMMSLLKRRFKDKDLLSLFEKILATYYTAQGKGLPIGNLISQHLANFYLGLFDHWIKEEQQWKGYLRYMDDMLFFGKTRHSLKNELHLIRSFLENRLRLDVKENIQLNRCRCGIPFLGYRLFPHGLRLSAQSRKRFVEKFSNYEKKWIEGVWTQKELVRHVEPLIAFTRNADTYMFRRKVLTDLGLAS